MPPAASLPAPEPAADAAALAVNLGDLRRDLSAAEDRWARQADALQQALAQGGARTRGSEQWAEAQVQLSRLVEIGTGLEDIALLAGMRQDQPQLQARADAAVQRHRATAIAAQTELDR